jgi:hypothetical protein
VALIPVLLFSCVGTSSNITFNNDGSGTLVQQYRIARELEDLGALDGNEAQPTVPVIGADLERTIARIPGLHLKSYQSHEDGKDTVHRAEIAFDSPEALSALFSGGGQPFTVKFPEKRITIDFSGSDESETNEAFMELMAEELQGYMFELSFSVPETAHYVWLDENGNTLGQSDAVPGVCSVSGKTAAYSVPMADLVYLEKPLTLEISW